MSLSRHNEHSYSTQFVNIVNNVSLIMLSCSHKRLMLHTVDINQTNHDPKQQKGLGSSSPLQLPFSLRPGIPIPGPCPFVDVPPNCPPEGRPLSLFVENPVFLGHVQSFNKQSNRLCTHLSCLFSWESLFFSLSL